MLHYAFPVDWGAADSMEETFFALPDRCNSAVLPLIGHCSARACRQMIVQGEVACANSRSSIGTQIDCCTKLRHMVRLIVLRTRWCVSNCLTQHN